MGIAKDTPLEQFTDEELTKSSAIHGDFDTASLDYSGHQNIEVRADTDAYTYAYTEGHSDSRKKEGFNPSIDKRDSKNFHDILRQKAEMESLTPNIVDVSNRIGETVGRVRVQDDADDMEDVFVEVENEDGDVIMEGKLEDEWTPNMEDMDYYYGESFEATPKWECDDCGEMHDDEGDAESCCVIDCEHHDSYMEGYGTAEGGSSIQFVCNECGAYGDGTLSRIDWEHGSKELSTTQTAETFEAQGGIVGGIIQVEGGGVHWAMQPDDNPDVQWIVDPNDPEGHTIAVPLDNTPPPTGGESGSGGNGESGSGNGEGGSGENGSHPQDPLSPQPEEENGGSSQEESNGGDQEGHQEEEQGGGSVDALAAESTASFLSILFGTTVTLVGLGLLSKKLTKKAEFHNETDEPIEEPDLIMSPNTGDLSPANYEELVVESTGFAVDIIPMGLDGSFMGSRFNALPTDRFIDYNEPGIGAHTDVALTRNENFREPEQSMVQASETDVKESQAPGQSPYFQMGQEPVDMNYRVLKETTTVSLDPAVRAFIPQSMSGYTGQKYAPPSVYEKMFGLGVSGITPAFVSGESDMGANRFGSRDAKPDKLSNIGGPLSDSVNAGYTDGNTTISLAQWSIENQVQPVSDTEAIVIDRSSGARKMIRRV
jgi:hypothetical protein